MPRSLGGTHTFALLEISKAAFDEIAQKLEEASYDHALDKDGNGRVMVIDMHGIGLTLKEEDAETLS